MIFNLVQSELEVQDFKIIDKHHNRPWGDFFIIAETRLNVFRIFVLMVWMFHV